MIRLLGELIIVCTTPVPSPQNCALSASEFEARFRPRSAASVLNPILTLIFGFREYRGWEQGIFTI